MPEDPPQSKVESEAEFSELVTVFNGNNPEAVVLKAALEQQGFHPFVANQYVKTIDPFITGGNIFEVSLQVPAAEARAAAAAIADLRGARAAERGAPAGERPPPGETPVLAPLDLLGRRLRWGMVLLLGFGGLLALFLPALAAIACLFYVYFACEYLIRAKRAASRPVGHGLTVASFVAVAAFLGVLVALFLGLWPPVRGG